MRSRLGLAIAFVLALAFGTSGALASGGRATQNDNMNTSAVAGTAKTGTNMARRRHKRRRRHHKRRRRHNRNVNATSGNSNR